MTGTPIQNNLTEFWALLDWVTCGRVLGDKKSFMSQFGNPIISGQNPKATPKETAESQLAARALLDITRPIILQRKKTDRDEQTQKTLVELPPKTELTVWVPLSSCQRASYSTYLDHRATRECLSKHESRNSYPVEVVGHLRSLTRHPFLLELTMANTQRKALKAGQGQGQGHGQGGDSPTAVSSRGDAAGPDISLLRTILNSGKKPRRPPQARGLQQGEEDAVGALMAGMGGLNLDSQLQRADNAAPPDDGIGLNFGQLSLGSAEREPDAGGVNPDDQDEPERQYLLPPGASATMPADASVFGACVCLSAARTVLRPS
jgi:hypothetical protein